MLSSHNQYFEWLMKFHANMHQMYTLLWHAVTQ